jgi:dTDP-4-amino-4,6-dideoxygalactose transaminase
MKTAGQKFVEVPMLDLSRQYAGLREEVLAAIARVCDSQQYILGEEVKAFEQEFAALCGSTESVACASGTDALWLAMAAAFSFYPTKNLSAFGDAGILTTSDPALAEHARSLRNHGAKQRYYHDEIGANSRMDSIQAAVLRVKMRYLQSWNDARRRHAQTYDQLLAAAGLTRTGANAAAPVVLLKTRQQAHHIYHQYVIRAQQRDKLRDFLKERGVGSEIYYPVPLHLQKCFSYLGYGKGDLPESERAAAEVLALPMFAELEEAEQRHVVESIAEFYS